MKSTIKTIIQRVILLGLVLAFSTGMPANNNQENKVAQKYRILLIHSYQFNLEWTLQLNAGIAACMDKEQLKADIFPIYLDTQRTPSLERVQSRILAGLNDYSKENIDLIICCDDAAFQLLHDTNHPIIVETPIVFCGVESLDRSMLSHHKNITGITQLRDFKNTFLFARATYPNAKNLYVITDGSEDGVKVKEMAMQQLAPLTGSMVTEYIDGTEISSAKLLILLQNIPQESIVIMGKWAYQKNDEEDLQEKGLLPALAKITPAPIFTVEETNIGQAAIGGFVSLAFDQAYQATEMGIAMLRGKSPSELPIKDVDTSRPIFDYNQLKQWNISTKSLPENSTVINEPVDFFSMYKTQIISTGIMLIALIVLLTFTVLYHFKYRKNIREKNNEVSKIQANLIEQQNKLKTILSSMGDGIISINNNNKVISINPTAMKYIGISGDAGEYIGKDVNSLVHITCGQKDHTISKMIEAAKNSEEPVPMHENSRLIPLTNDKETIYISGNFAKMVDEAGKQNGVVIAFRDITEDHQQKEELIQAKNKALEADKLKTAFLANMSHEIRTPLNGIVGFATLLAEGDYEAEEKDLYVNIINTNCQILLGLITDILDLSRIESGSLSFRMEECTVQPLVTNLVNTLQVNTAPGVVLRKEVPDEDIKIITDSLRLTQVLTNLVNNAIKFTTEGSITIGYELINNQQDIHFYVRDTGCGMSKEDLKNIFARFFKKDEFAQGAGLGLAICDAIVEKFGGTITVDSELGQGTVFDIVMPYFRSGNFMHPDVAEANIKNKTKAKRKKVILVAEDDNSNFRLIDAVLNKEYTIIRAWNGDEAVEVFKTRPVDLILMDVKMPNKTGMEALIEIRKISTDIPVVMQTAYAFDTDRREAVEAGCDDFITKPIQVDILKETIKRFLEVEEA